ncbi:MAG: hypothetical protein AAF203_05465, partial [Pseudomonadota bacterium]
IKQIGDRNMMAVRNVVDAKGRVVMVAGQTYTFGRGFSTGPLEKKINYDAILPVIDIKGTFEIHGLFMATDRIIDRIEEQQKIAGRARSDSQKRENYAGMLGESIQKVEERLPEVRQMLEEIREENGWSFLGIEKRFQNVA